MPHMEESRRDYFRDFFRDRFRNGFLTPKLSGASRHRKPGWEPGWVASGSCMAAPRWLRPLRHHGALCALLLGLALSSCAEGTGWVVMEDPGSISWTDDGGAKGLSRAISQSIAYYRGLPPKDRFQYGEHTYSPGEMIASLELFREEFYAARDDREFAARLSERFHIFESISQKDRGNLFTGYYEPELEASDRPVGALKTPLYALPEDIVQVRLRRFGAKLPPLTLTGRVLDNELIPYYSRREIQGGGALGKNGSPIAYVNEVDLFFLQIQGSGTLRYRDGRRVKIGYVASNGHPYRSIGALLVRQGEMELEEVSLQSIRAYLAAHPRRARQVLFANPSYVFFQIREDGPLGNIQVPLTPGRSLALDRHIFPKGGLAYVTTMVPAPFSQGELRPLSRFMLVQDTGGAIRGHGRGDLFFGAGKEAEWQAGNQKHAGRLLLLVAKKEYLNRAVPGAMAPEPAAPEPTEPAR